MTYKHTFEVGDDVRIIGGTQEYHIVFVNYTAQNATLRNPANRSYQFGIPFAMLEPIPAAGPQQSFRVGDRVMLVGDMKDLYDVKGAELELPTGWKYQIENLTGNVGGWYEGRDLALYATKETLESLKAINEGTKATEQLFPPFNLSHLPSLDSALAEARKSGPMGMTILKGRAGKMDVPQYQFDPEESLMASVKPYRKPIDVQDALRILLEATQLQMEYVDRNPDPKFIAERITANKLLAHIRQIL